MAKQTGLTRYRGTLGGVKHFKIKGLAGDYAGLAGGPTGERIKTAPEFQRTRENMSEFAGCARAGRSIRHGLSELMGTMSDTLLTGRLVAVMKKINLQDGSGIRGMRKVEISANGHFLHGFPFDKNTPLMTVMYAPYELSHTPDRLEATFDVPAFLPVTGLKVPEGATHFRLINAIVVVSDFAINVDTGTYEPTQPAFNELHKVEYGQYHPVHAGFPGETLTASLMPGTVLTADTSVLHCIGIEFSQYVGSQYYVLASGNSLVVDDVF